jgi:hypothetical protein
MVCAWKWMRHIADWGTVPQWLTALIALGALAAAIKSIGSQREIARKRAAMDFFIKTEMDRDALAAHKKFTTATDSLQAALKDSKNLDAFATTDAYWNLRDYLNLHELMSVGILNKVLDDDVCYFFWSGEMERTYENTLPLIRYVQTLQGEHDTYIELVKVAKRWMKRDATIARSSRPT